MSKWALFVSDTHVGSAFALWPRGVKTSSGSTLSLNSGQRYLGKKWEEIKKRIVEITGGHIHVLFHVGDAIQGKNKKNDGEFIIEPDMAFQGRAAIRLLAPLREISSVFYQFRGSGYHVGPNAETEEWVAKSLGGEPDDLGHYCWRWLPEYDLDGVIFDIAHHQSAVMVNRAMPLERERRYSNQLLDLKKKPDLIVRAHGHVGAYVEVDGEASLGLTPLQLQTPFAQTSITPNRYLTRWLGVTLIKTAPERRKTMEQPFSKRVLRFKHPRLTSRKYSGEERKWTMEMLDQISQ